MTKWLVHIVNAYERGDERRATEVERRVVEVRVVEVEAEIAELRDGHLFLLTKERKVVAVFPPGWWQGVMRKQPQDEPPAAWSVVTY